MVSVFQISLSGPVVSDLFIILFIFYPEWDSNESSRARGGILC